MKKQSSIMNMMSTIFAATILVQVLILLSIVYIGKIPQKIREQSYRNFDKNIIESRNTVLNIFDSKLEYYVNIEEIESTFIQAFGSLDNVKSSSKEKQLEFIESYAPKLIQLIANTDSNSAYIILENENMPVNGIVEREGLYISFKKYPQKFNNIYQANIYDNSLELNLYNLVKSNKASRFVIDLESDDYKFYNALSQQMNFFRKVPLISYRYQEILNDNVINVSYPIVNETGRCVAIIGTEVTFSNFYNITPGNNEISYLLGITDGNSFKVTPIIIWGKKKDIISTDEFVIKSTPTLDQYYSPIEDEDYAISLNRLELYQNSNPYTNENWVFLGITEKSNLISSSNYVENAILVIIIISLIFGSLMIYVTIKKIAAPIKLLSEEVRQRPDNQYFEFSKSNVEEVNNLILNFEKLSYNILQYSNKITNAINTFLLGIYFYKDLKDGIYCTQAFLEMCGSDLKEGYVSEEEFNKLYESIINSYYDKRFEAYLLPNDRWVKLETKLESSFNLGIVTDITDQVNEVKKMEKELDIDPFTKLYNRIAFQRYAKKIIESKHDKVIVVIMWDMDNLKFINDRYGHEAGDRYIMQFADNLRLLENYKGIVARRSGDEFYAIMYGENKESIIKALEKVRNINNESVLYITDEITEKIRASVGLAWYPENGKDLDSLLAYADKKLYQSKYEYITTGLNTNLANNVNLFHFNKEFLRIIDGDYITFAYQPIVDAKTGKIFGYEMLMRIFSDILNNPKKLIDIARENEKLEVVEELTFKKGFENYNLNIQNITDKKIFINSISNAKLADKAVKEILNLTNNNLDMLVVELTGLVKANKDVVSNKIKMFRSYNAQVAIDNFKPEFIEKFKSNINVDYIKVDISIINNIESSLEQQKKLQKIVSYAKAHNYKVVAVGVKNYEELAIVINSGVDYLQGFYIGEPTVKPISLKNGIVAEIKSLQNK